MTLIKRTEKPVKRTNKQKYKMKKIEEVNVDRNIIRNEWMTNTKFKSEIKNMLRKEKELKCWKKKNKEKRNKENVDRNKMSNEWMANRKSKTEIMKMLKKEKRNKMLKKEKYRKNKLRKCW